MSFSLFSDTGEFKGLANLFSEGGVKDASDVTSGTFAPFLDQAGYDAAWAAAPGGGGGGMFDFLGDSKLLSSYAGLGSALANFAALPSQIDFAKTQTKMLKHNLSTAKKEQARRDQNIASFNRPSQY